MRRGLQLAVGVSIAGAFVAVTVRKLDWTLVAGAVSVLDGAWIALGLLALTCGYALRIVRWGTMLALFQPGIRFGALAGPLLAAFAMNNVLPFRAGDVARAFAFRRTIGVSAPKVLGTLLVERFLDLATLLVLLAVGLALSPPLDVRAELSHGLWAIIAGGLTAAALAALLPRPLARLILAFGAALPPVRRLARFGARMALSVARLLRTGDGIRLVLLSFAAWTCEGGLFLCVAQALHQGGSPVGPLLALPLANLATLIPGTPGHFGTFHYFAALALELNGGLPALAALFAFTVHAFVWAPVTLVGGLLAVTHVWPSAGLAAGPDNLGKSA